MPTSICVVAAASPPPSRHATACARSTVALCRRDHRLRCRQPAESSWGWREGAGSPRDPRIFATGGALPALAVAAVLQRRGLPQAPRRAPRNQAGPGEYRTGRTRHRASGLNHLLPDDLLGRSSATTTARGARDHRTRTAQHAQAITPAPTMAHPIISRRSAIGIEDDGGRSGCRRCRRSPSAKTQPAGPSEFLDEPLHHDTLGPTSASADESAKQRTAGRDEGDGAGGARQHEAAERHRQDIVAAGTDQSSGPRCTAAGAVGWRHRPPMRS